MPIQHCAFGRQRRDVIVTLNAPRIVPDEPGGWFVIRGSYGWLYGSRPEALLALRELASEARS